ncbi:MAG: SIS domain-containing protein [Actinomycetota bacterium]|nr:SIS domain-containing protein [Actinomycetota bacterium]PLS74804.1 MAG: phosphoheptose isomerase [Actinomycetota bacterium]
MRASALLTGARHLDVLRRTLDAFEAEVPRLERWALHLAEALGAGGRLLAAGNGGSAAEAQHLTAELVGRYRDDRRPYSAIALHAESSTVTAVANDYGLETVFARQVEAHGRRGDVLIALSTSGRSANLLRAVDAATRLGMDTWALTGPGPNPLADCCDDAVAVEAASAATVQECHLVAVHLLCAAFDVAVGAS